MVDGVDELVPANIGIVRICLAELHTHDASGEIHVESTRAGHEFTFSQFLTVYGKAIERPGYTLQMTVDGVPNTELGALPFKDKQNIVLTYTHTQ